MSYDYEINYNNNKKKSEQSKYIYKSSEDDSQIFIFELILKSKESDNKTIIRKLKKNSIDTLISYEDNIMYNDVDKFKLTIIDINNPDKPTIIKHHLNHELTINVFINDRIYIETYSSNNMMIMNYNIN